MSPNDTHSEHVVTAIIVAHDGAEWLPRVVDAVLGQTHPVQRIVAVDTGSRDRSGTLLADLLGPDAVFGMERKAGYGAAVALALQHRAATAPVLPSHQGSAGRPARGWGDQGAQDDWAPPAADGPAEWIWLLHDDCEPDPGALAELLRGAAETPGVAVLGPKVLDWADRRVILEAGLTIDTAGRRISGTEPREIDQGQHDGDRDVLAVSSAGMLARRDAWNEVGGFDVGLSLFRDDVDFCWRVHAAGYRVRVITEAVVYHLEASARGRRQTTAAPHPRRADRRNALLVLLANLPLPAMIAALAGNMALSAARILFFLLAKRPQAAQDEAAAFGYLLARPGLIYRARRRRRARGGRRAYGALRSQVPRGRSLRKLAEFAVATLSPSSRGEAVGTHHASDDPSDDDSLLTDSGFAQRFLTNPGILLFTALTVIALVAERSLLGSGPLGGGALLPAWGGASGLWGEYLAGFHTVSVGSAASTPPYVAVIAALSTILGGKPWLAVAVILLGCVPISGVVAYLASRRVSAHTAVRVWLAVSYALLPVATGVVAAGRLGTAVVFMLIPLIASTAGRMLTQPSRRARRAAWATGLLIAVAAAFVPLVWVVAVIIAALGALAFARTRRSMAANLAIVALVPPVLLAPWTLDLIRRPSLLLLEAGLQQPGLASRNLPASSLLLLSPGGPGTPPAWVAAGLLLAALAALLLRRRGFAVAAAWGVALAGLLTAIAVSRFLVSPLGGGPVLPAWPGAALIVAALGLLLAVAVVGDDLAGLFAAGGLIRAGVAAMVIAACAPPLLTAGYWIVTGVTGPVTNVAGPVLPEFVSLSSATGLQLRTLVLRPGRTSVRYTVLRDGDPPIGAEALTGPAAAGRALDRVVAGLTAPYGSDAGNPGQALAQFAIGYVLLPAPVNPGLARLLDGVVGLRAVSQTSSFELWRVAEPTARVSVIEPSGARVVLPSGPVDVSAAAAPAAGGTLTLAEPASGSWHASVNGRPLTPLPSPVAGWAQGFRLPAGGGRIDITRDQTGRDIMVALEAVILVVVGALALPGAKDSVPDAAEAAAEGRTRRAARTDGARGTDRAAGTRGTDRAPGARRGSRGAGSHGRRRRPGGDGADSTGPRRILAAGRLPARSRSAPPDPAAPVQPPVQPAGAAPGAGRRPAGRGTGRRLAAGRAGQPVAGGRLVRIPSANRFTVFALVVLALVALAGVAWLSKPVTVSAGQQAAAPRSVPVSVGARACPAPGAPGSRNTGLAVVAAAAGHPGAGRAVISRLSPPGSAASPLGTLSQPGTQSMSGVPAATGAAASPGGTAKNAATVQPGGVMVQAAGSMAQGLEAEQTAAGGVVTASCGSPGTDFWFAVPGQQSAGTISLALMNVDGQASAVNVDIFTDTGPLQTGVDTGINVPPHAMVVQSLAGLVHGSRAVALHVRTSVGRVVAALREAAHPTDAGQWLPPAQSPSTRLVIPGMPAVEGRPGALRGGRREQRRAGQAHRGLVRRDVRAHRRRRDRHPGRLRQPHRPALAVRRGRGGRAELHGAGHRGHHRPRRAGRRAGRADRRGACPAGTGRAGRRRPAPVRDHARAVRPRDRGQGPAAQRRDRPDLRRQQRHPGGLGSGQAQRHGQHRRDQGRARKRGFRPRADPAARVRPGVRRERARPVGRRRSRHPAGAQRADFGPAAPGPRLPHDRRPLTGGLLVFVVAGVNGSGVEAEQAGELLHDDVEDELGQFLLVFGPGEQRAPVQDDARAVVGVGGISRAGIQPGQRHRVAGVVRRVAVGDLLHGELNLGELSLPAWLQPGDRLEHEVAKLLPPAPVQRYPGRGEQAAHAAAMAIPALDPGGPRRGARVTVVHRHRA